ncbi:MAG: CaiB/BaiF CoA-transferase family protein [Deltaproteobacteria bacterium]|nr:CaiB/BaiF CoA-transferase family protein [Deltaproteobacteria bacterium]
MPTSSMNLPLAGIRVLDLSRVLAGPFCGALLGDIGADVIKVEEIKAGDEVRAWPPLENGESAAFIVNNRNKRGIAVDMKTPEGVAIIRCLASRSDVLLENFRTGTMEEFGLSYESLAELNPRLIYCSISAFGRTGPRANEAGYEALMQAFTGIMSITGETGGQPVRCGVSFLDLSTSILCAFGIVTALYNRKETGLGQRIDGTLLSTAMGLLNYHAENYFYNGVVPKALGSGHPSLSPYRNFRCGDNQWIFIAGGNDRLWKRVAHTIGLEALVEDPKFATNPERVKNREELEAIVQEAVGRFDRPTLLKALDEAGVPATPVNTIDQVLQDPQVEALKMVWPMTHPAKGNLPVVAFPLSFSRMGSSLRRNAPRLGEHTEEILGEVGYSKDKIAELRKKKVIL